MKSLKALSDHIRSLQLTDDDTFDSWAEDGHIEPSGSLVVDGLEPVERLFRNRYTAVFSWENFSGDANQLFGEIIIWLNAHNYDYDDLGNPEFDVEILTDDTAEVEIRLTFEDSVYNLPIIPGEPLELVDEPTPEVVEDATVCDGALKCSE